MKQQISDTVASVPPLTVVGLTFLGVSLDDWLKLLGVAWILIQMGTFIWRNYFKDRDNRNR